MFCFSLHWIFPAWTNMYKWFSLILFCCFIARIISILFQSYFLYNATKFFKIPCGFCDKVGFVCEYVGSVNIIFLTVAQPNRPPLCVPSRKLQIHALSCLTLSIIDRARTTVFVSFAAKAQRGRNRTRRHCFQVIPLCATDFVSCSGRNNILILTFIDE